MISTSASAKGPTMAKMAAASNVRYAANTLARSGWSTMDTATHISARINTLIAKYRKAQPPLKKTAREILGFAGERPNCQHQQGSHFGHPPLQRLRDFVGVCQGAGWRMLYLGTAVTLIRKAAPCQKITGQTTDPNANETIADSLRDAGAGMFRPLDPLSRERIAAEQRHGASRAKAAEALSRGDTREYIAQSIMADQSADDAVKYAGQPATTSSQRAKAIEMSGRTAIRCRVTFRSHPLQRRRPLCSLPLRQRRTPHRSPLRFQRALISSPVLEQMWT